MPLRRTLTDLANGLHSNEDGGDGSGGSGSGGGGEQRRPATVDELRSVGGAIGRLSAALDQDLSALEVEIDAHSTSIARDLEAADKVGQQQRRRQGHGWLPANGWDRKTGAPAAVGIECEPDQNARSSTSALTSCCRRAHGQASCCQHGPTTGAWPRWQRGSDPSCRAAASAMAARPRWRRPRLLRLWPQRTPELQRCSPAALFTASCRLRAAS